MQRDHVVMNNYTEYNIKIWIQLIRHVKVNLVKTFY